MSGTMYRPMTPTLASLLAQAGSGVAQSGGQTLPPQPDPQQSNLNDLLSQAFQPDNPGPPPEKYKASQVNRIAAAIGDAAAAYARVYAPAVGNPNYQAGQRAREEFSKARSNQYEQQAAESKTAAGRAKAQFLLNERDRNLIREDNQAAAKALKDETIQQQKDAQAQALMLAHEAKKQQQEQFDAQKAWEERKIGLQGAQDQAVARIHANAKTDDEGAKFDQKKLPEVMSNIGGLADVADVALAGGDPAKQIPGMTQKQMQDRVRRLIEGSAMGPDAKKAAAAFAERELGQVFKDFDQAEAAKAQQGTTVEGPPGILSKLGSVLTGKANLYNPGP